MTDAEDDKPTHRRDTPIQVLVGESTEPIPLQGERAGATRVWTDDNLVATAALGTDDTYVITGVHEGKTTVNIQKDVNVYTGAVTTVRRRIDRYVDLVLAKDGSQTSTYSYTYDGLDAWTNKDPTRIQVTKGADNKTLTFTPLGIGHGVEVVVPAYVDGNGLKTDIHYFFTIYLKAGYAWDVPEDEAYAATAARRYNWTVVSDWNNTDAAVDVRKSVIWDEQQKDKAVVRIDAVASPEKSGGGVPNVLFLGSLCNAYALHTVTVLNANGDTDTLTYTLERDPGNDVGEYPIHAAGDEYQSGKPGNANPNYHVTYVPGIFSIGAGQAVLSLWITDHEYASENEVYLAFLPRGSVGAIDAAYVNDHMKGRIKVRYATRKADLADAPLRPAPLRYPEKPVEENGWIWIRTTLPATINVQEPLLWEIVIDDEASREAAK